MPASELRRISSRVGPPPKFAVPWGLFVILALYGLGLWGYVWQTYWESPAYQAATHDALALRLLGVDDGRTAAPDQLRRAFDELLEAGRLLPEEPEFAQHLERLRHRFEERHLKLDVERVRRAEAVSNVTRRIQEERAPLLVVGARSRDWAPDQLLAGPRVTALWSIPGVVLVIALWAYLRVTAYRVRSREREAYLKSVEAEVKELGRRNRR